MKNVVLYLFPLLAIFVLTSCTNKEKGPLTFSERSLTSRNNQVQRNLDYEQFIARVEKEKIVDWEMIVHRAKEQFEPIRELVQKKCFDCHDSSRKLPFYGRIFPRINPVNKHQVEGLLALDMVETFPFKANGKPLQLSLLKAFRSAVMDRTMPLKSYTIIYPFRKINKKDKEILLNWVMPLIDEIEEFDRKYEILITENSLQAKVKRLLQSKCLRCHGNGNHRGNFSGLENLAKVLKNPRYANLMEPEKSLIYTISASGEMPTDLRERLSSSELDLLLDYITTQIPSNN